MTDSKIMIYISDGRYKYGNFDLDRYEIGDYKKPPKINKSEFVKLQTDCAVVHYFCKELKLCPFYRASFINNFFKCTKNKNGLKIVMKPTQHDLIDYRWNDRIFLIVRERCEVDHALSWLSTLGGAFSALGDYSTSCAEMAGKISFHQLKLALKLGDPNIAARCRLYLGLSLIQQKKFRMARRIIESEYRVAKNATIVDTKLLRMCQGIWAKLKYEYILYKLERNKLGKT